MERLYLLFEDVPSGMALYRLLKESGFRLTIAPTPRQATGCCGVSVLLEDPEEETRALALAEEHGLPVRGVFRVETDYNPKRDRYL